MGKLNPEIVSCSKTSSSFQYLNYKKERKKRIKDNISFKEEKYVQAKKPIPIWYFQPERDVQTNKKQTTLGSENLFYPKTNHRKTVAF